MMPVTWFVQSLLKYMVTGSRPFQMGRPSTSGMARPGDPGEATTDFDWCALGEGLVVAAELAGAAP
jgi:hypothetical protein